MQASPIIVNFTAGEISPRLMGRVDLSKYYNGCKTLENYIVFPHGGVTFRPGTYYVADVKTHTEKVRLIAFEFSTIQNYILEFGHQYMRVYKDKGQLLDGANPYEIATPYLESELFELKYVQSADVMYIVHPAHKVQKLTRTGHILWTMTDVTFTAGVGEEDFADADHYPAAIAIFEERLCLAATGTDPQAVWMSITGDWEDFTLGAEADNALKYVIAADRVNAIQWMVAEDYLLIGTVGGEWRMGASSAEEPITPTNIICKRQSTYGSKDIQGLLVNDAVLFTQRAGKKIREMGYSYEKDGYTAADMTILGEHITGAGITNMDYQQEPDSILWCIRSDGVLIGMTYERAHEVVGWHRHPSQLTFESVAVIPGDGEDEIWVSATITVDGDEKRFVLYFTPRDTSSSDPFFVDAGLTYDGGAAVAITGYTLDDPVVVTSVGHPFVDDDKTKLYGIVDTEEADKESLNFGIYTVKNAAANTFELYDEAGTTKINGAYAYAYVSGGYAQEMAKILTGASHLKGKTVALCTAGATHPEKVVSATGTITLDLYANKVQAGLSYTGIIETVGLEAGAQTGTSQGKIKRIHEVGVRFYETIGCKVGYDADHLETIPFRTAADPMDAPPPLFTGDKVVSFPGDYDREATVMIVQDLPLPSTVLAIMPTLHTYE